MSSLVKVVGGTWNCDRDWSYWEASDGEFTLQAEPGIREYKSYRWIGLDCSLAHSSFGRLANHIAGNPAAEFFSLRWFQHAANAPIDSSVSESLTRLMREARGIATATPLEVFIDEFEVNRPDGPSMGQLRHLAALAWKANVSTLLDYQGILRKGKRLNFVPMITASMVERALDEALKRAP